MCPGGSAVAAASEENRVVTNGMSKYLRDGRNANSAILHQWVKMILDDDPLLELSCNEESRMLPLTG